MKLLTVKGSYNFIVQNSREVITLYPYSKAKCVRAVAPKPWESMLRIYGNISMLTFEENSLKNSARYVL